MTTDRTLKSPTDDSESVDAEAPPAAEGTSGDILYEHSEDAKIGLLRARRNWCKPENHCSPCKCQNATRGKVFVDSLFDDSAFQREPALLRPGAWQVPQWLNVQEQSRIVEKFFEWGNGPVPPHQTLINDRPMSVRSLCLGWHWSPNRYSRTADDINGAPVAPMEPWLVQLGKKAVLEATGDQSKADRYHPDVAIVNYYDTQATMGMHQDADELVNAPVVSISIGDSANFRLGNNEHRNQPWQDLRLASGDLFVFDGAARFAFHAVTKIFPDTAPKDIGLAAGRINITLRQTGLS